MELLEVKHILKCLIAFFVFCFATCQLFAQNNWHQTDTALTFSSKEAWLPEGIVNNKWILTVANKAVTANDSLLDLIIIELFNPNTNYFLEESQSDVYVSGIVIDSLEKLIDKQASLKKKISLMAFLLNYTRFVPTDQGYLSRVYIKNKVNKFIAENKMKVKSSSDEFKISLLFFDYAKNGKNTNKIYEMLFFNPLVKRECYRYFWDVSRIGSLTKCNNQQLARIEAMRLLLRPFFDYR